MFYLNIYGPLFKLSFSSPVDPILHIIKQAITGSL